MQHSFTIKPDTGAILIDGIEQLLHNALSHAAAAAACSALPQSTRDHGNGYGWLYLEGLAFGGKPATMRIVFQHDKLFMVTWDVNLRPNQDDWSWPSPDMYAQYIAFVRSVLRTSLSRPFVSGHESFSWGQVWCDFDPRGDPPTSGLRFA